MENFASGDGLNLTEQVDCDMGERLSSFIPSLDDKDADLSANLKSNGTEHSLLDAVPQHELSETVETEKEQLQELNKLVASNKSDAASSLEGNSDDHGDAILAKGVNNNGDPENGQHILAITGSIDTASSSSNSMEEERNSESPPEDNVSVISCQSMDVCAADNLNLTLQRENLRSAMAAKLTNESAVAPEMISVSSELCNAFVASAEEECSLLFSDLGSMSVSSHNLLQETPILRKTESIDATSADFDFSTPSQMAPSSEANVSLAAFAQSNSETRMDPSADAAVEDLDDMSDVQGAASNVAASKASEMASADADGPYDAERPRGRGYQENRRAKDRNRSRIVAENSASATLTQDTEVEETVNTESVDDRKSEEGVPGNSSHLDGTKEIKLSMKAVLADVPSRSLEADSHGADIGADPRGAGGLGGETLAAMGRSVADLEAQWQKEAGVQGSGGVSGEGVTEAGSDETEPQREEKLKAEQEALRIEEERKSLFEFIHEVEERIATRNKMREENVKAQDIRPDESFFFKLDSNLKRNTAFVKKLKNLSESQKDSLIKDINSLNLTKYIGEAAAAIAEAKLKMSDISCALAICSLLHQRYADFGPALLDSWHRVLPSKKDDKVVNASKLRVDLRLFADLISAGVFTEREGLPVLATQLTLLTGADKDEHNNVAIIISFCKHCGDDYAGLVPRKFRLSAERFGVEIPRSQLLRGDRQKACRNLIKDYYTSLCKHVVADCKELRNLDRQNRRILQTKGELTAERKEKLEATQSNFQKLFANCGIFADLVDEDVPDVPEEEMKVDGDGVGLNLFNAVKGMGECPTDVDGLFEDEDTRQFYESLPDLKAIIPGILYKDSEHAGATLPVEPTAALDDDFDGLEIEDLAELASPVEGEKLPELPPSGVTKVKPAAGPTPALTGEKPESQPGAKSKHEEEVEYDITAVHPEIEEDETEAGGSMKALLEVYLNNLPKCVNRELIDNAAVEFCMNLNTKMNRRKLVRALFFVQRTRYDLLPFYARLVATLYPCMPSVAVDLAQMLKSDFRYHVKKKDQINIESKLKSVRFIGELVKFNMFEKADVLQCLKFLMMDFTHHNIEMVCTLLETCGRYLYRTPATHHRLKIYLEMMLRKKQVVHLDARYSMMIDNAYYYSNPPESRGESHKLRAPMHEYVRRLLYKDLSKSNIEKVLRQMRKLNWNDAMVRGYTTRRLTAVWNVRYGSIHCVANLLAGLAPYQELVGIQVIDSVLEDIRLGMEINYPKYNQRRVSLVKYLGELYNYRLIESQVVFSTLYSFITFGVSLDESSPSVLDPPEHLFRIRLVCVLLDTCGQYFDRGSSRKKLDCFLIYFQRYFWHKKRSTVWTSERPFPMDIEYMMYDTVEALRPRLRLCKTWEEAGTLADQQDKEFSEKIAEMMKDVDTTALTAILEAEETETAAQGQQNSDDDGEGTLSPTQSQSQKDALDDEDDENEARMQPDDDNNDEKEEAADSANDDDDDDVVDPISGDEDQVAVLTGGLKHIKCTEDDDFLAAFDKLMSETMQARTQEVGKITVVDIAVPVNIKSQQQKMKPPVLNILSGTSPTVGADSRSQEEDGGGMVDTSIPFTFLSRKGNKQQLTTLNIPLTETFASKFKEQKEVVRAEKERIKKVVLDIHERQEEEDYQEMIAQMSRPLPSSNAGRDRRPHYQHPKGAPDADAIFGSKFTKR